MEAIKGYLAKLPEQRAERISNLIHLILKSYPECLQSMKFKMPTFECDNGWVAVANQKHYVSLYTCSAEHLQQFKTAFPAIKTGKGCINFRDCDPLPTEAIEQVIKSAMSSKH